MLKIKTAKKEHTLQTGSVLMAKPFRKDDRYSKSVILVTEHDADHTEGVIINKDTGTALQVDMKDLNLTFPIYYGGPFAKRKIVSLHKKSKLIGSSPLT